VNRRAAVFGLTLVLFVLLAPSWVAARLHSAGRPVRLGTLAHNRNVIEWPRGRVLDLAVRAWQCGRAAGEFDSQLLTVIDYSLPSTERRLWVLDLVRRQVLFHEFVAHGRNTGENFAVEFSNQPGSLQSSLGLFRTEETYRGRHGLSLRLVGLESGFNDRAQERAIVLHGAPYVSRSFIARHGQLGRSWGCPVLDRAVSKRIIERIKDGSALFIYYPDDEWLRESDFLSCERRQASVRRAGGSS
jgi:hypothetical protein